MAIDRIESKNQITIKVDVNVRNYWNNIYVERILSGIQACVLGNVIKNVKMMNIQAIVLA